MADSAAHVWPLTKRFDEALVYAACVHEGQFRKGTAIPYVAHLLAVCAMVLEDGGDEDEAIAALLHDAVEDAGGSGQAAAIRQRFGARVARIVEECSDTEVSPKPPWRTRKEAYVERAKSAPDDARRVSLADKIHNARSILLDYRQHGEGLWARFRASGDEQVWYFEALVAAFRRASGNRLVDELARVVGEIKALRAARGQPSSGSGN
jgi:(p)ppGpp synthase/HD superfamily hydrolase